MIIIAVRVGLAKREIKKPVDYGSSSRHHVGREGKIKHKVGDSGVSGTVESRPFTSSSVARMAMTSIRQDIRRIEE